MLSLSKLSLLVLKLLVFFGYLFVLGDTVSVEKFQKRLVKVTSDHTAEAKRLLTLMGVPYIEVRECSLAPHVHPHTILCCTSSHYSQAPCEAEAQCAALARAGKVFATATEDMDALTFGSTVLLRNLTASEAR